MSTMATTQTPTTTARPQAGMKRVLITGATGHQGGAVLHHLLPLASGASPKFLLRAFVRHDRLFDKAPLLRSQGVEIIEGDLMNMDEWRNALKGVDIVFLVTNYWQVHDQEMDVTRLLVDCCRNEGISHLIYSSFENVLDITDGKYTVKHFTQKAVVEEHIISSGIPYTFVHSGFFMENFGTYLPPKRKEDGTLIFDLPTGDRPIAMLAVDDLGAIVAQIIQNPELYTGKTVMAVSDYLSAPEMVGKIQRNLNVNVELAPTTMQQYRLSHPELAEMFSYLLEYQPYRNGVEESRKIVPQLTSFEEWVRQDHYGWARQPVGTASKAEE